MLFGRDDPADLMRRASQAFEKNPKEAASLLGRVLRADPGNREALYRRGLALNRIRKYSDAVTCFEALLESDPEDVRAHNNRGIEKDGAFYLFTLRLVPLFPFFVVNLVMALSPIRTLTFAWVSQVGMLAGTVVFVNAGTQLGRIESPGGILSPAIVASFVLLGVFPWIARRLVGTIKARRARRG